METDQEFAKAGNSTISYWKLADMGVSKILATQEYTHSYLMWNSIAEDKLTWVHFKARFRESYPDREELEQTEGAADYSSVNNVKHGEMEDAFMHFASETAVRDAAFTELTTTNGNLSTQLRHQKDQIRALQAELCNLKVAAETRTTNVKGNNKVVHLYARKK